MICVPNISDRSIIYSQRLDISNIFPKKKSIIIYFDCLFFKYEFLIISLPVSSAFIIYQ